MRVWVVMMMVCKAMAVTTNIALINVGSATGDGTGDAIRTAFMKANTNFMALTQQVANVTCGSGSGSFTDAMITNSLTLIKVWETNYQTITLVGNNSFTNMDFSSIYPGLSCTDAGGTYHRDWSSGTNVFTNACGFYILYETGISNYVPSVPNAIVSNEFHNVNVSNLWKLWVSGSSGSMNIENGTYIYTNRYFSKVGSSSMLYFRTGGGQWWYNRDGYGGALSSLLGQYTGVGSVLITVSPVEYNTNYGFSWNYVPNYYFYVHGAGSSGYDGIYNYYGTDQAGEPNEMRFTNSLGNGNYIEFNSTIASSAHYKFLIYSSGGLAKYDGWQNLYNGATAPNPSVTIITNYARTNLITIVPPFPPHTPFNLDGYLTYTNGGVCKYLYYTPQYMAMVNSVNNGGNVAVSFNGSAYLILGTDGTAYLNLSPTVGIPDVTSFPQTDTNQWRPCP